MKYFSIFAFALSSFLLTSVDSVEAKSRDGGGRTYHNGDHSNPSMADYKFAETSAEGHFEPGGTRRGNGDMKRFYTYGGMLGGGN